MDSITNPLGGNMAQNSRVGQKGDLIVYSRYAGGSCVTSVWVEVLDDTAAAVWKVKDLVTGKVFDAMSSQIRFYN